MAPSTRNQTAGNQQTKPKEQTTKQQDSNGIPKKGNAAKASKTAERTLNAAVDAYEKADDGQKAAMQDQLNVHQPMEKPVAMDVAEDNVEPPGEQQVKKESDEGSMYVLPIDAGQNQSSQKADGSTSDQEQSSREEKDPEPSGDNNQGKLPQPKVAFRNDLPTPPADSEDELDLVRANPLREILHDGAYQDEGWVRLAYGSAFDVERQGPPNAARFRFKQHNGEIQMKSLDDVSYGIQKQLNGKKLYNRGEIIAIQGVVWQSLKGLDHYSSLAPRNWKGETRAARPPMRILVKWAGKDAEGERWPVAVKWEKRDAVLRCWQDERGHGDATVLCEEELRLGEVVLVKKGESLSLCDFVIVTAAYRCEKRFREWESKQRPGLARSPTPGLPLKDEKQAGGGESPDVKAQASQSAKELESTKGQADSTH
ncbi:hypothetical protein NQ176_g7894 [Zarea fungicola]|uniref:Uncharacterized protein n=1 Tax=Zarea fungicola TaxID=93591 RepID=A0ACC1MXV1_9HYPO|nr:hypothetical protein NQ176_g7894 [Lecanicillium fungicola]